MLKVSIAAVAALLVAGGAQAAQRGANPPPIFVIALENHNFIQPDTYTHVQQLYHNPAAPAIPPTTASSVYTVTCASSASMRAPVRSSR